MQHHEQKDNDLLQEFQERNKIRQEAAVPPHNVTEEGLHIARGNLYHPPDWAWATVAERDANTAFLDILRFTKDIIPLTYPVITDLHTQLIAADHEHSTDQDSKIHHVIIRTPSNSSVTKQVIGRDGHYFNLTTENHNLLFIWHRRLDNTFHFWGKDYCNVLNAVDIIKDRIYKKSIS